jgi:hypothetical protein
MLWHIIIPWPECPDPPVRRANSQPPTIIPIIINGQIKSIPAIPIPISHSMAYSFPLSLASMVQTWPDRG